MRIIAGKARGVTLKTIEGLDTRPTTDRIKENIFNIISFDIMESNVLDLFSGSGAIALEFASRGSSQVTVVENNIKCIKIINENIDKTNLRDLVKVIEGSWANSFRYFDKESYDIIFMDPPYSKNLVNEAISDINKRKLLKKDGIIIAEHDINDKIENNFGDIEKYKFKKYGRTGVTFYRRK